MALSPPAAFDYLRRADERGRLGHAYLLTGKRAANELADRLAALAVGSAGALSHRDVHTIEPESKSRRIVIEQIRDLESSLRLRASQAGGRKVGIIREADRLQTQASNAFLKTLEEPPAQSLLLLITAQPEALPDTIVSRCIRVALLEREAPPPSAEEQAALDLLAQCAASDARPSVPKAYGMARSFTELFAAARARVYAEQEAAQDQERAMYKQTTDGSWLAERKDHYKALSEARYLSERARIIERLARWWGDVLRVKATGNHADALAGAAQMAAQFSAPELLAKLGKIDDLRENLDRNIQEALALETAFLHVFGD